MRRWLMLRVFRWITARFKDGDYEWALKLMSEDVHFFFPGSSAYAADLHGKADVDAWFRRFVAMRPTYEVLDVMVSGPIWDTRVAVRFRDSIGDDYSNEGMHYAVMKWGKLCLDRVFLDTEKVVSFEERHPELAAIG